MSDIAQFAYEKQTEINNLRERVKTLELQANSLLDTTIRQAGEMVALRDKAGEKIINMRADTKQQLRAVEMILTEIKDSQSNHWQKKEDIRLCLGILAKISKFEPLHFGYDDDF